VRGLIATSIIYSVILCGGQRYTRLNKKEKMARPYLVLKRYNVINKGSDYKLDNVTSEHCPTCYELLFKETHKDIDYPYVCLYCDENFYNIELEKIPLTKKEVA
jgi:hypothetical protein